MDDNIRCEYEAVPNCRDNKEGVIGVRSDGLRRTDAIGVSSEGLRRSDEVVVEVVEPEADPLNLNECPRSIEFLRSPQFIVPGLHERERSRGRGTGPLSIAVTPEVALDSVICGSMHDDLGGSYFQMVDPNGSTGFFRRVNGTPRVLF